MYVHEEKKVCFIAHPRTASTATGKVLLGKLDFGQCINHHGFKPGLIPKDWTVFATVRNPFDLLVSWYWHKRREHEFPEWLPIFLKESNEFLDKGLFFGLPYCTHVLRYENLQDDFNQVIVEAGFPPTEIPQHNVSLRRDDRPLSDYYDFKLINLMKTHFDTEIQSHGYEVPR